MTPLCAGCIPVASAVPLTSVVERKTGWWLSKNVPDLPSAVRVGMSASTTLSRRRPSMTTMST
jgi:hypothetical protein